VPDNITVASVQQYKANVELLMQQTESRLTQGVTHGDYVGKAASVVEQFGEATAQKKTGRHTDTPLMDLSQDKRWVHPIDWEWGSLIDKQDQLRAIIELTSPYAQAGAAAMNRAKDDAILTAFFGTNYTGENGTTSESFSATYEVGVNVGGTASSINVAKLQNAIALLIRANKGELMEAVFGAISSYEHDSLLKEMQVVSKEYGNSAVLVDGKVKRFMGVDFTITERLNIVSGNRLVPVWVKSGMHLGKWGGDMLVDIGPRRDKSLATQVYLCGTFGATRTQLGKQIKVLCDDQI
jgi:hypothetical protein